MERKEIFRALVGSHNYGLATPESDKDYKVFIMPTFDDLYNSKMYSKSTIGKEEDLDVHDIRKLSNLFFKANVNFLEVLYSTRYSCPIEYRDFLDSLMAMREDIVTMNLPYLYNACEGMFHNKMKYLEKGTEGTQHLVEKYGYDTKQALHAFRILNFIVRLYGYNYDFKKAMVYETDWEKHYMLEIKDGVYNLSDFNVFIQEYKERQFNPLRDVYKKLAVNYEIKEKLEKLIYDLIYKEIAGGK